MPGTVLGAADVIGDVGIMALPSWDTQPGKECRESRAQGRRDGCPCGLKEGPARPQGADTGDGAGPSHAEGWCQRDSVFVH